MATFTVGVTFLLTDKRFVTVMKWLGRSLVELSKRPPAYV